MKPAPPVTSAFTVATIRSSAVVTRSAKRTLSVMDRNARPFRLRAGSVQIARCFCDGQTTFYADRLIAEAVAFRRAATSMLAWL